MGKRRRSQSIELTKLYKGFRVGERPILKVNIKNLLKQKSLTDTQHHIVQYRLDNCTLTNSTPEHVALLNYLLDLPVVQAKVDAVGNPLDPAPFVRKGEIKLDEEEKDVPKKSKKPIKKEESGKTDSK